MADKKKSAEAKKKDSKRTTADRAKEVSSQGFNITKNGKTRHYGGNG